MAGCLRDHHLLQLSVPCLSLLFVVNFVSGSGETSVGDQHPQCWKGGHCHPHCQSSPGDQPLALLLQLVLQAGGPSEGESPALYHVLDALQQPPPSLLAPQLLHSTQPQLRCLLVTGVPAGAEKAGVSCSLPICCSRPGSGGLPAPLCSHLLLPSVWEAQGGHADGAGVQGSVALTAIQPCGKWSCQGGRGIFWGVGPHAVGAPTFASRCDAGSETRLVLRSGS